MQIWGLFPKNAWEGCRLGSARRGRPAGAAWEQPRKWPIRWPALLGPIKWKGRGASLRNRRRPPLGGAAAAPLAPRRRLRRCRRGSPEGATPSAATGVALRRRVPRQTPPLEDAVGSAQRRRAPCADASPLACAPVCRPSPDPWFSGPWTRRGQSGGGRRGHPLLVEEQAPLAPWPVEEDDRAPSPVMEGPA